MRLFVVFRTFDRIWTCKTYTRELAPFELDMSGGAIKLMFMVDHIVSGDNGKQLILQHSSLFARNGILEKDSVSFYCQPHDSFFPVIIKECKKLQEEELPSSQGRVRRFSVPSLEVSVASPNELFEQTSDIIYFVLPICRCTVLLDAHVASCISRECSRSKTFRWRLWKYLMKHNGFRDCVHEYEQWTQEERDAWDNYMTVPYMIDVVAVWPKQKLDYAWIRRVLGLLCKYVVLMEGFAWLSTLGGAHSSLGETFRHHAEKAGEISKKQLKTALELGDESLIARSYIFWSWSLLQRGELRRCKACVLNTWKFCQNIRSKDWILEAMCKAVWSRLKYKKAARRAPKKSHGSKKELDDDKGGGDGGRNSPTRQQQKEAIASTSITNNGSSTSVCADGGQRLSGRVVSSVRVN
ncbi:hypothetical protein BgiMline_028560 [Biomphalaria glabrata]|uniref:Uncharacterized protein LOC106068255 n=1 Tax=Biomphalaria glabrata TaxID=6526 RepID=A0A9W2YIR8_BIOGL|nr:uncharacterized protein LOC106068255 [Biomphalaria glabrata]XP_055862579.1 uncharacterized protein LOC106068255 [Biomphalaria glabrata]KAI8753799.1 hypothetical protein BgiMline_014354 [Biomphalaria glabrata]